MYVLLEVVLEKLRDPFKTKDKRRYISSTNFLQPPTLHRRQTFIFSIFQTLINDKNDKNDLIYT